MSKQGTYSVPVYCSNCEHTGVVEIKKGVTVPSSMECPNCGCYTARKNKPTVRPIKSVDPFRLIPWTEKDWLPLDDRPNPYTVKSVNPMDKPIQRLRESQDDSFLYDSTNALICCL